MPQSWRPWQNPRYAHGSPISGWSSSRVTSRRPRRSARCKSPTSRNGGRSSKPPASRPSDSFRQLHINPDPTRAIAIVRGRSKMTISSRCLHPLFGAEVSGVDLCKAVDQDTFDEIETALDQYAVLVFRGQPLNDDQQFAFSRLFGPIETSIGTIRKDRKHRMRRELSDISNLDENSNIRALPDRWRMMMLANQLWHTDSSFRRVSGKLSLLSAREIPPSGGETEFADLRAAYDALDQTTKERIEGLVAEHSIFH